MAYLPHFVAILAVVWLAVAVFLIIRGGHSPQSRRAAIWMLFGPMGLLLAKDAERPMTRREIMGWAFVIVLVIGAIALVVTGVL